MIQVAPQMRILVAIEPADFRCGIDDLAKRALWRLFVFRTCKATAVQADERRAPRAESARHFFKPMNAVTCPGSAPDSQTKHGAACSVDPVSHFL